MKIKFLLSLFVLLLFLVSSLTAQTLTQKTQFNYPVADEDSVLAGLASIRNVMYHPDPLGNGVAAFAATNYFEGGKVSVFKNAGDDALELIWTTPINVELDTLGGNSTPRYVVWGDLDNDGLIELIYQNNKNGILIWEWDGVTDSWNFGDEPAFIIGEPDIPLTGNGYTEYIHGVDDYDGDGVNELIFSINSTPSANDRYYFFSMLGNYPGFAAVVKEKELVKTAYPFSIYGGGTPWAALAANLDGAGNPEIILHNWNFGNVSPMTIPDANTYELADTTHGKHYYYLTHPDDEIAYMGGFVYDIDNDGREEVYIPMYNITGDHPGELYMIHYEEGDTLEIIKESNVTLLEYSDVHSSNTFGYGYGDYDQDGHPNLYFSGGYGHLLTTMEFQGGDKTDPANWTTEILYEGDSTIYRSITYYDSAGIVDTTKLVETSFVSKFSARHNDFDKDGYEDMILSFQAFSDSIPVAEQTWTDSLYITTIDSLLDSMVVDSSEVPWDSTYYYSYDSTWANYIEEVNYNIVQPKRWSIRMLESDILSSLNAKDIRVITPEDFALKQNYPNPFNPETTIEFFLPINKKISLIVYNTLGQKIKTLIDNQTMKAGSHEMVWDGTNEAGHRVATGMYIYTLKFGNFSKNMKMMLVK